MWFEGSGAEANVDQMKSTITNPEMRLYVGTDSHSFGGIWLFATVICCHIPGRGGRFYTRRNRIPKDSIKTLPDRLLHEAYLSISAAQEIEELYGKRPEIHLDVSKKNQGSGRFYSIVTSYVLGMGYSVSVKPDAWASSSIADRQAR
jgi:predicted RNase H-related nuclease YkuK (DUF458 family)